MAQTSLYSYEPLFEKHSIRILSVLPGSGNELIRCELQKAPLATAEYEALSYVWGSPEKPCRIQCDGKTLNITQNLYVALLRLRDRSIAKHLWVDAVCINQGDNDERTSQVLMMGQIYSHAKKVLVWLGDATPDVPQALDLVNHIVDACLQHHAMTDKNLDALDDLKYLSANVSEALLPEFDKATWLAFRNFYIRPWFSRVWVVQEVMKARTAIAICGEFEIEWARVIIPALWMRREQYLKPKALSICDWEAFFNAAVMGDKSLLLSSTPTDLLRSFATLAATDPRDKVYALAGLTLFEKYLPIVPDYNANLSEAYGQVVKLSIQLTKGLDVLSWVRHGRSVPDDFPSWIPRWDQNGVNFVSAIGHMFFNASEGLQVRDFDIKGGNTLELRGLIFDRISSILPIMKSKWLFNSHLSLELSEALGRCLSPPEDSKLYPTGENLFTVFSCVLTAGLRAELNRVWGEEEAAQHTLSFLSWLRNSLDPRVMIALSEHIYMKGDGDKELYESLAMPMRDDRRLFYTQRGYIGIGPAALQIEDEIAVIYGGRVPYVVRERPCGRQFVGECYVHGSCGDYPLPLF